MFAQTTHCVQIRDRGFGGDDMGLLDLMPANISPGAISFAILGVQGSIHGRNELIGDEQ